MKTMRMNTNIILFICCLTACLRYEHASSDTNFTKAMDIDNQPARSRDDLHLASEGETSSIHRNGGQTHRSTNNHRPLATGTVSMEMHDSARHNRHSNVYPRYGNKPVSLGSYKDSDAGCIQTMSTLTCRTVPSQLPPDVSTLIVTSQDSVLQDRPFQDTSFAKLSHLSMNGIGLKEFSASTFSGLDGLRNLTLRGMHSLYGSSLQMAITSANVLPKMKYFALNPGSGFLLPFLKLENTLLTKLANNGVDCLNLSNIITEVKFLDLYWYGLSSHSATLNLTGSFLIVDYSNSYEGFTNKSYHHLRNFHMKVLDVTRMRTTNVTHSSSMGSEYEHVLISNLRCGNITPDLFSAFFLVENWYVRNLYKELTDFQGYCDLSSSDMYWRTIVVSGNHIVNLNITLLFPQNNSFHSAVLTNNRIEYISTGLFITWFAMKELRLSGNELYHMEHATEFEKLLTSMTRLSLFDIANNSISYIPLNMFQSNRQLNTLILANNRLKTITFEIKQLVELRVLDVRDNAIVTLDSIELNKLQLSFHASHEHLIIQFEGNPIRCSCESVNFITWLVSIQEVTNERIVCDYVSEFIDVDRDAVGKCEFLCHRTLIIAVSTVCSFAVLVLLLSAIVIIRHKTLKKKKRDVEWQLRQIVEAGDFMCFMAISGNDEALVERVILEYLRRLLQGKFGLDRDLVCTGTRFKPGFAICEEAYRLMKKCQVFIAVVSESFMRSQYCKIELQEACKQNKPTILIFYGHVETEDMPQYMQEVFRRTSRAWIKQNDEGYYYVVPNLIDMSEAIWDLAIADLLHKLRIPVWRDWIHYLLGFIISHR